MTDDHKEKIKRMRQEGQSYSKIALTLGISENTIKSYCRRNNLTTIKNNKPKKEKGIYTSCKQCGKPLTHGTKGQQKKFCCEECRRTWWKANDGELNKKAYYLITCKNCNKLFESYGNKNRKYCCHECYVLDAFTKKRESLNNIAKIISEFYIETNSLSSCERAAACTSYSGKILSNKVINKLIDKYSHFVYELQNNGLEEK